MKTIWGLIFVVSICTIFFFGLQDVSEKAAFNNPNLDDASLQKIEKYNTKLVNLTSFASSKLDTSISSNNTNEVETFYRETAENKNTIEKFRDSIEFIYNIPTFFLLAIPFIDIVDSSMFWYNTIIWFILSVLVLLAMYKAIRTGTVDGGGV